MRIQQKITHFSPPSVIGFLPATGCAIGWHRWGQCHGNHVGVDDVLRTATGEKLNPNPYATSWEQESGHSKRPSMKLGQPTAGWPQNMQPRQTRTAANPRMPTSWCSLTKAGPLVVHHGHELLAMSWLKHEIVHALEPHAIHSESTASLLKTKALPVAKKRSITFLSCLRGQRAQVQAYPVDWASQPNISSRGPRTLRCCSFLPVRRMLRYSAMVERRRDGKRRWSNSTFRNQSFQRLLCQAPASCQHAPASQDANCSRVSDSNLTAGSTIISQIPQQAGMLRSC